MPLFDFELKALRLPNETKERMIQAWGSADELDRLMKVRRAALNRLGAHTIRNGAPMATVETVGVRNRRCTRENALGTAR